MRRSKIFGAAPRQGVVVFVAGPKGNAIRMAAGRAFLIGVRVYLPEPENTNST